MLDEASSHRTGRWASWPRPEPWPESWPGPADAPGADRPLARSPLDSADPLDSSDRGAPTASRPAEPARCALTIDLEEWFHGLELPPERWVALEARVVAATQGLLDLLALHDARATFFVLGRVAEAHPELVHRILAAGHEVGSHGHEHQFVYRQTPDQFARDLEVSLTALQRAGAPTVVTYRAPYFSVTERSLWALDILAQAGITLDSSIMPAPNPRYGIPDAPLGPHQITTSAGPLLELSVSCLEAPWLARMIGRKGLRSPFGGGFYLRFFPLPLLRAAIRHTLRQGRPPVLYLHPWELDPDQPRIALPARVALTRYYRLGCTSRKLTALLREFRWQTLSAVAQSWQTETGQVDGERDRATDRREQPALLVLR